MKTANVSKEVLNRRFLVRNRKFRALTKGEQKLKIIRDIITHLKSGKINAREQVYINFQNILPPVGVQDDLREIVETTPGCEVCAVGGMFVSALFLKNKLLVGDALSDWEYSRGDRTFNDWKINEFKMRDYLLKWFTKGQIALIEMSFEKTTCIPGCKDTVISYKKVRAAVDFGVRYKSSKARLLAICKNMLKNNGVFVP